MQDRQIGQVDQRTQRDLALFAGGELTGRRREQLERRLEREPSLRAELAELKRVRRLYAGLAEDDVAARLGEVRRHALRSRVLAELREQARPKPFWQLLLGQSLAAAALVCVLGLLLSPLSPADNPVAGERSASVVAASDIRVLVAHSPQGALLRWNNGEDSRYQVLGATRTGQETVLAVVCGSEWVDTGIVGAGFLSYRVERLPEQCG